ncbi:MAG TPA: UDP-N-acetylglucosamine 2-epimerase (non-hydrolyzing) [Pirellulales bacterium]|nr:UDP-N-acetylglucosamine 2-epimerase (non-hydrolyzing) [Pirellulales bacterium]
MPPLRPLLVIGTRPEAIKLAPIVLACRRQPGEIEPIVCLTGQHREMLDQVVEYFGIEADVDLGLMRPNQSLTDLTARCLSGLDEVLNRFKPDCVVAQGDTTTTAAAALAAFYRRVPLVHVEAGLRTGNMQAPWPEELNRRMATLAAALHCAPTEHARQNLLREHVPADSVVVTGNTVVDALVETARRERGRDAFWREKHDYLADRRMVLITCHRRENVGEPMAQICRAILMLAAEFPDVEFVFPIHLNPQVHGPIYRILRRHADENLHLLDPVGYAEFVWLMDRSSLILSDSGGVQEEAPSLGKRVLVMRDTTERPEAVAAGFAELVGADVRRIVERAGVILCGAGRSAAPPIGANPYGDGRAAERIIEELMRRFVASADISVRLRLAA